jgi:hypothetical protein
MKRKVIITCGTDYTNVYGYIQLQVINPDGTQGDYELLPVNIRHEVREQYPSTSHIPDREIIAIAKKLRRLGWEVLNEDCEPYFTKQTSVKDAREAI